MAGVLPNFLHPLIINDRIDTLIVNNDTFQSRMNMQAGGSMVRRQPNRNGTYDIYDSTRRLPKASNPGTHSVSRERFPIGKVNYSIPRVAEHYTYPMEEINQNRPQGAGTGGEIDELGQQYLMDQERNIRQTNVNLREFQVVAMCRGSYTYTLTPDGFEHAFSGGGYTINFQIPAGNKSQLDMLGAGDIIGTSWDNAAAPIVRDLLAIDSALTELTGRGLYQVEVTSEVWGNVITNTEVQNLAGSSNDPVQSFTKDDRTQVATAILRGAPWVTWVINNNGLDIGSPGSETFTKLIEDTGAMFCVAPSPEIAVYWECPEPVVDPVTQNQTNQYGDYYYAKFMDDPVAYQYHTRFNGLPVLLIPKSKVYGTVVF